MSKILELYKSLEDARFIQDIFFGEEYRDVLPQLTIIDAGAYEGEFSFFAFNCAKKIYAFEPDPRPYEVLKKRIKEFELGNVIKIYNKALTVTTGKTRLFHASGGGGSRLIPDSESEYFDPKTPNVIKVKSMTLHELFKTQKINQVDILKIDIEGGEWELFNDPKFAELAPKIKLIIGEHLGEVDEALKAVGFKSRPGTHRNTIYEQS